MKFASSLFLLVGLVLPSMLNGHPLDGYHTAGGYNNYVARKMEDQDLFRHRLQQQQAKEQNSQQHIYQGLLRALIEKLSEENRAEELAAREEQQRREQAFLQRSEEGNRHQMDQAETQQRTEGDTGEIGGPPGRETLSRHQMMGAQHRMEGAETHQQMMDTGAQHHVEEENLQENEMDEKQGAMFEGIFERLNQKLIEAKNLRVAEKQDEENARHQMLEAEAQERQNEEFIHKVAAFLQRFFEKH